MKFLIGFALLICWFQSRHPRLDSLKNVLNESRGYEHADLAKKIATTYLKNNQYDSAEKYFNIAIKEARQIDAYEMVGKCLNNKGVTNYLRGRFKEAIVLYQEAISYYEKAENDTLISRGKTNLGLNFKSLNVYDKALNNLYEGAKTLERLDLKKELSSNWNAIGNIHRELNNSNLSIEYLTRSLNLRKEIGYKKGVAQSLQNIGIWNLKNEVYEKAYENLLEAYKILSKTDVRTSSSTLAKLGEVVLKLDSVTAAENYFLESLRIRRELNDENGIAVSSNHLARLYLQTTRWSEALPYLEAAQKFGLISNSLDERAITHSLFQQYYTGMSEYRKALEHANLLSDVRRKILDKEKARSLMEAEIRYEVDRKKQEIFEKEAELASVELRTTWLLFAIAILVIFLIVLVWLYVLSRKLAKERKSGKERVERLLKELNHRTKNHLQGQMALIRLQSTYLKDGSAKNIMREVGNRMKAITLIHQSLYDSSEEAPENINLSEYLRNLTENLMISFKYNRNRISINYKFDQVDIDIHYAVPIGLIVNEAVTNTFKYAFTDKTASPVLKVCLVKNDSNLSISVKDNGKGFEANDQLNSGSFGMKIMRDLAKQLKGKLTIESKGGTNVALTIPIN